MDGFASPVESLVCTCVSALHLNGNILVEIVPPLNVRALSEFSEQTKQWVCVGDNKADYDKNVRYDNMRTLCILSAVQFPSHGNRPGFVEGAQV